MFILFFYRQYIEIFKQKIMSSVDRQNNGTQDLSDDQALNTVHNVAFYPVCKFTERITINENNFLNILISRFFE